MKLDATKVFENIISFYTRLPLAQKIALPLLMVGSMFVIVFVARWARQPEYVTLFSNLEDSDAAAVVEKLKDMKVGYMLKDGGKTVAVTPPDAVHDVRLELASSGLPKGSSVGFELFAESKLGMTPQAERLQFLRGLQGELERTIMSIDAVKAVRVHITLPEKTAFVKRQAEPTASVLLRLKAGEEITPAQVKGIAHLVAGSVERLTPENVTIMDSKGTLLNQKQDAEQLNGADLTRLEYQRSIENGYARRIETMLSEILGVGGAVARVTAELDFSKFEKEEEAYDPAGQVMRSERMVEENSGKTAEGGVTGVVSNLTNDPSLIAPPEGSKNGSLRRESVKNFEVSRAVSRTSSSTGKIARLSAAVLVDGQYTEVKVDAAADGAAAVRKQYKPLSADMIQRIENLVKQAIGFDATRGDVVTVENIKFAEPNMGMEKLLDEAGTEVTYYTYIYYGICLVGLILFFLLVNPIVQFLIRPTDAEVDLSRLLPAGVEELEAELDAERGRLSTLPEIATPTVDIEELEALLAENSRLVRDNPQQAALLIRYWLNDGRI